MLDDYRKKSEGYIYLNIRLIMWMWLVLSFSFCCQLLLVPVASFNVNVKDTKVYSWSNDSFFGFSMAFLSTSSQKWLLVGAPKAEDPLQGTIRTPGVVLRCPLDGTSTSCIQVPISTTGDVAVQGRYYNTDKSFKHQKSGQLLGFSIAVSPQNDHILACAPKWSDDPGEWVNMFGMCYEVGTDFSGNTRLLPITVDRNKVYGNNNVRLWKFASLGFTAEYDKTGNDIVLGAPGLYGWSGGYAVEENRVQSSVIMPQEFTNANTWLIGYSLITTTRLATTGATYIVTGAPKRNIFGSVIVFNYKQKSRLNLKIDGDQIGSFFGAALCVVDVNNDNLDDIVVGAPFHSSNKTEEGRVFVWINKGQLKFERQMAPLTGTLTSHARFGATIANIGDFNKDDFNDVAIGAPYEEDGVGVVYIYNGYSNGVWPTFTQRIPGSKFSPGLRTFGSSLLQISLTTNEVLAIGAFDADRVVVLKSNPVVVLTPRVVVHPPITTNATTDHNVSVCFQYTRRAGTLPDMISLEYSLAVDTQLPSGASRSFILPEKSAKVSGTFLVKSHETCMLHQVVTPFQHITLDVGLHVRYKLAPSVTSSCLTDCPTLEAFNGHKPQTADSREVNMQIKYDKMCGADNKCDPRLALQVIPRLANIVVGRDTVLTTDVIIHNSGEPAYNLVIFVAIVGNLTSPLRAVEQKGDSQSGSLVDCARYTGDVVVHVKGDLFRCLVRTPYPLGTNVTMTSSLKMPLNNHASYDEFIANFSIRVADEPGPTEALRVPIMWSQSIKVESSSVPEEVPVKTGQSAGMIKVEHRYSVGNLGPSPIRIANVHVFVPLPETGNVVIDDNTAVSLNIYNSDRSDVHRCHVNNSDVTTGTQAGLNGNLTCDTAPCRRYVCTIQNVPKDQFVLVSVHASVKRAIVNNLVPDGPGRVLTTMVVVYVELNATGRASKASTSFYKISKTKTVRASFPVWQVAVAAGAGFIVILVAGIVMIKMGCFKRASQADMKKRMSTRMSKMYGDNQIQNPPDQSPGDSCEGATATETPANSAPDSEASPR